MCRSIHTLYHINPPATKEEIYAASLQYVRKVSGYNKPSKVNEDAYLRAVDEVAATTTKLLSSLQSNAVLRDRKVLTGSRE